MMAMVRLNVPSVFLYGGSILPGALQRPRRHRRRCVRGRRQARRRDDERRRARRARARRLPLGRQLRRPVHGEHDGLRVRSHRPCAARLGRRAGALRIARPLLFRRGRGGDAAAEGKDPPARHRDPQGAGECRGHRRRHRRLDQRRAAPAGDRPRGGHRFRHACGRENFQAHALPRRPHARRKNTRRRIYTRWAASRS